MASIPSEPDSVSSDMRFDEHYADSLIPTKFCWEAEAVEGRYHVREYLYVGLLWYLLFAGSYILLGLSTVTFRFFSDPVTVSVPFIGMLFSYAVFVSSIAWFSSVESPISGLLNENITERSTIPLVTLLVLLLLFQLLFLFASLPVALISFLSSVVLLVVYAVFHEGFVQRSRFLQMRVLEGAEKLPVVATNYMFHLFLSSIMLGSFVYVSMHDRFLQLMLLWPIGLPAAFSVFVGAGYVIFYFGMKRAWSSERLRFISEGQVGSLNGFSVLLVSFPSLLFGYLSYIYLRVLYEFILLDLPIGLIGLCLLIGLPVWFFVFGLIFQVSRFARAGSVLRRNSYEKDLSHILDVEADTYVLEGDGLYAGAVTLPDMIIVSEGLLSRLSDDKLACVLAHEEGHIEQADAKVSTYLMLASPFLLTGANVLYSLFNFREREFRADDYAVSRIGDSEIMYDTLDELESLSVSDSFESMPSPSPTLVSLDAERKESSILETVFGFYYGSFAVTGAHPSLDERKKRVGK